MHNSAPLDSHALASSLLGNYLYHLICTKTSHTTTAKPCDHLMPRERPLGGRMSDGRESKHETNQTGASLPSTLCLSAELSVAAAGRVS